MWPDKDKDASIFEARESLWGCTCRKEEHELHICPFKQDIYDDNETLCDCCPACTHECAMDI